MKNTIFAAALIALMATGAHEALALTTEQGNSVPSTRANVADPDDQTPVFMQNAQQQQETSQRQMLFNNNLNGMNNFHQDLLHRDIPDANQNDTSASDK